MLYKNIFLTDKAFNGWKPPKAFAVGGEAPRKEIASEKDECNPLSISNLTTRIASTARQLGKEVAP